jgi:isopenicillin N synthase-like dioxygenase
MLPSYQDISSQIQDRQHAIVPFSLSHEELSQAMSVFIDFLALPQEVKDAIYFQVEPSNRGTEVGYKLYKRDLGNTDNREYFHYHALAEERFAEHVARIPELARLMDAMRPVYDAARETFRETITQFEDQFPGIRDRFFPTDSFPHFYLRFLKYDRLNPGDFLAKGHYDRGTCTLALAESAPGLRMGLNEETLHPVTHDDGKALFMPGIKFHEVTSADFPPTWHDVVQQNESGFREDIARWAIVFFIDHQLMSGVTYEEAHTPRAT